MSSPFQKALKLPATKPDRIVSDVPPSRVAVTISFTCLECELVKILVNSGMSTAASVPQLMMVASCHQRLDRSRLGSSGIVKPLIKSPLMRKEVEMHRMDAIQMRRGQRLAKWNFLRAFLFFFCVV